MASIDPVPGSLSRAQTSPTLHVTRRPSAHRQPRRRVSGTRAARNNAGQVDKPSSRGLSEVPTQTTAKGFEGDVEHFAEHLTRWKDGASLSEADRYRAARNLVQDFTEIARKQADKLKAEHQEELEARHRKFWSRRLQSRPLSQDDDLSQFRNGTSDETTVEDAYRWEEEHQTWRLLEGLLPVRYPETTLGSPPVIDYENDRFAADGREFEQHILSNNEARERLVVMKWLEQCSGQSSSDLPLVYRELEQWSEQGEALWSAGWMNTRERIKAEKRLRLWNTSLEGVPTIRDGQGNLLIHQLDSDAVTRLQRTVDYRDSSFNAAFWLICFQILRRGASMEKLYEFCEACNETTTALTLGALSDVDQNMDGSAGVIDRLRWRKTCLSAATQKGLHPFEAATFGLLGGDLKSVESSCADWKDLCHAHLNAQLLGQYRLYIKQHFGSLLPPEQLHSFGDKFPVDLSTSLEQMIESIKDNVSVRGRTSTHQTSAILQMSLISNSMLHLLVNQGVAIAQEAAQRNDYMSAGSVIPANQAGLSLPTKDFGHIHHEPHGLRVLTHIFLVFQILGINSASDGLPNDWQEAAQNVCAAYIQFLFNTDKYLLIPLYACYLSRDLAAHTMAKVLPAIVSDHQREECVKVMSDCHMDITDILGRHTQYALCWFRSGEESPTGKDVAPLQLLEKTQDSMWPRQRICYPLEDQPDPDEEVLNSCGEWYLLTPGCWFETFNSLLEIAENILSYGRIQTALELIHQAPPRHVSFVKSPSCIGLSVDIFEEFQDPSSELPAPELEKMKTLQQQALMYFHCTLLVEAIQAMWDWRVAEESCIRNVVNGDEAKQIRQDAIRSIDRLKGAMDPILSVGFLIPPNLDLSPTLPDDDTKNVYQKHQVLLAGIREAYLPELVLAYNSALHCAGHLISRDNFIGSLELGKSISTNDELIRCFTHAKRIRELVDSLALTSKAMLKLNEQKPHASKQRGKGPKTLGIWDIKA